MTIAQRLRTTAIEVADENIDGWGNLMSDAANRIDELEKLNQCLKGALVEARTSKIPGKS